MATALIQKQTANLLPPKSAEEMDKDDYRGMRQIAVFTRQLFAPCYCLLPEWILMILSKYQMNGLVEFVS
eukprot:scaffold1117_cov73-Skeletonema_marinoi.AAC.2